VWLAGLAAACEAGFGGPIAGVVIGPRVYVRADVAKAAAFATGATAAGKLPPVGFVRDTATDTVLAPASVEAADRAVEGGLPDSADDPTILLRVPGGDEGVETIGNGLLPADELGLRRFAALPVVLARRDR
jgi:hypothetical protein